MADDGSPMNGSRSKGNSALLDTAFLYGEDRLLEWPERATFSAGMGCGE